MQRLDPFALCLFGMLTGTPSEKEWVSWLWVLLCSGAIFAAVPVARSIQEFVAEYLGRETFTALVVASACLAMGAAFLYLRKTCSTIANYIWLLSIGVVFIGYTFSLRQNPEEALHFIEYGVLVLLVCRALVHRVQDSTIYLTAVLFCIIVGILDEGIQWAIPGRFWGIGDIWLNSLAAILVMTGVALGLRPPIITAHPTWRGFHLASRFGLVALVLLGASLLNTPARIAWYSDHIPFLQYLKTNESVMWEYGYLYHDPEIGTFRSRLPPEALRRADKERATEAARLLDRYLDREDYRGFLKIHTPVSDPFLHEARVHLFSRDVIYQEVVDRLYSEEAIRRNMSRADRENRILEKYFGQTLNQSSYVWDEEQRALLERDPADDLPFESRVSLDLVTSVNELQIALLFVLLLACMVGFSLYSKFRMNQQPIPMMNR